MIKDLLPSDFAAVEAFDDAVPATLFAAEEALVRHAVDKRRREFATARRCAREALASLGCQPAPILPGERGAPQWPAGVVGSITHCTGYRAAVVAPMTAWSAIGIDAEPNEPLPRGVLASIAIDGEFAVMERLLRLDGVVRWDRLLFSAKESVYKAWFPLTGRRLDFHQASITFDRFTGRFDARLLVPAMLNGRPLTVFSGSWLVRRGLVLTAITVPAAPAVAPPPARASSVDGLA